ncbi:uncharacterized protein TRIADDRAFT_54609 [Trichoplax adhaerens]|uniref:Treslin N-terminal domain-containing protein n=1 Tax=Trichoplax adhaerens TaxID=10228 RepID=B3RSI5_TRIAD|nr:predicted protein [Trichoplax adhaerens]EDV27065.1 predicted protein [Trichoplax adhaerens]|eukprot:XP_002111061.1 predicted protein [Trichoplax adhaerens]
MAEGSFKVILLIDATACKVEKGINLVHLDLGLLRILSYLNHVCIQNGQELSWGYKFYSCDESNVGYEKRQLVDMSLKNWEKFQEITWKILSSQSETTNHHQQSLNNKSQAKYLNQALTEVTIYFPWNQPDLLSPTQLNYRHDRRNRKEKISPLTNLILIIRPCPLSSSSLKEFFGKEYNSLTAELLEENLLTDILHQKLTRTLGIGLGWIDVNHGRLNETTSEIDKTSYLPQTDIIEQFNCMLSKLRGFLIPISVLTDSGCIGSSLLINSGDSSQNLVQSSYQIRTKLRKVENTINSKNPLNNLNHHFNQPISTLNAHLLMIPTKKLNQCYQVLIPSTAKTQGLDVDTNDNLQNISLYYGNGRNVHHFHGQFDLSSIPSTFTRMKNLTRPAGVGIIKGIVSSSVIPLPWHYSERVFTVSPSSQPDLKNAPSLRSTFTNMMIFLKRTNQSLVIEFSSQQQDSDPLICLMESLTDSCAILKILKVEGITTVEKLLIWRHQNPLCHRLCHILTFDKATSSLLDIFLSSNKPTLSVNDQEISMNLSSQFINSIFDDANSNDYLRQPFLLTTQLMKYDQSLPTLQQSNIVVSKGQRKELPSLTTQARSTNRSTTANHLHSLEVNSHRNRSEKRQKQSSLNQIKNRSLKNRQIRANSTGSVAETRKFMFSKERNITKIDKVKDNVKTQVTKQSRTKNISQSFEEEDNKNLLNEYLSHQANSEINYKGYATLDALAEYVYLRCTCVTEELSTEPIVIAKDIVRTVVLSIQNSKQSIDLVNSVVEFLNNKVVKSVADIRENYGATSDKLTTDQKMRQFIFQIVMRLEIVCLLHNESIDNNLLQEITMLLQRLSFLADPGFANKFLDEVVLECYLKYLGHALKELYTQLMLEPPQELSSPSKTESDIESLADPVPLSMPTSPQKKDVDENYKPRALTRHRSFQNLGKVLKIAVPAKKKMPRVQSEVSISSNYGKDRHHNVKRNLFHDASDHNKESKSVADTPLKKQVANPIWRKQERARRKFHNISDVCIRESPISKVKRGNVVRSLKSRFSETLMSKRILGEIGKEVKSDSCKSVPL